MDPTKSWAYVDFYYADLELPEVSGIYIVFAAKASRDIPIYVGQSKNLKARWKDHHKTLACLRMGAEYIRYLPLPLEELNDQEDYYIKKFDTALNFKYVKAVAG